MVENNNFSKNDDFSTMTDEALLSGDLDFHNPNVNALISRYTGLVFSIARRFSSSHADSDDLASEGFLGLMNALTSYDPQKGLFKPFAITCITNKIKTALSSGNIHKISDNLGLPELLEGEISGQPTPEELIISKERSKEIMAALSDQLTSREFAVMVLYTADYKYDEIAKALNLDKKAVDNALQRARKKLRHFFKEI